MQVTEVEYGFTFKAGNHQSECISVRITLEPNETPEQAMDHARQFVQQQHQQSQEIEAMEERIGRLERQAYLARDRIAQVQARHRDAVQRYNDLRSLLLEHSVEIAPLAEWLLPAAPEPEEEPEEEYDNEEEEE